MEQNINSTRKPYYTQTDNMLMVELNPYQYMLLSHYYRICSFKNQETTISDKKLAKLCGFSVRKLSSTRKELQDMGYINIEDRNSDKGKTLLVTINDVQLQNFEYWQNRNLVTAELEKPVENREGYAPDAEGYAPDAEGGMHDVQTKNNKYKKNKEEKELSSSDDDTESIEQTKPRPRDLIFDWIAYKVFGYNPESFDKLSPKLKKTAGARIGKIKKVICQVHADYGTECTVKHLNLFWEGYHSDRSERFELKSDIKWAERYLAWYMENREQQQRNTDEKLTPVNNSNVTDAYHNPDVIPNQPPSIKAMSHG